MNSYELSRSWFDFCFENPEKVKPNHTAVYFFSIEHCNRLGWKKNFGFPTTMVMEAVGIKSYNTYIKTLNELVDFGVIIMIERSKNQYSANIIALSKFDNAPDKALNKALIKHGTKQSESTEQSISSIIKQYNKETINLLTKNKDLIEKNLSGWVKKENSKPKQEVIFPFNSDKFLKFWDLWKDYKKNEHNFKYKTVTSEQAALKKLMGLCGENEEKAILIIEESISNGWKGFFKMNENGNGNNNNPGQSTVSESYKERILRDLQAE